MAIRYQIATWYSATAMEAVKFREVSRLDAALDELWRQIYSMIAANAGLDTKAGWRLSHEFDAFAARLRAEPLRQGYMRQEKFIWRNDPAGILDHVIFRQERV